METKNKPLKEVLEMQIRIYEGLLEEAKADRNEHIAAKCEEVLKAMREYLMAKLEKEGSDV